MENESGGVWGVIIIWLRSLFTPTHLARLYSRTELNFIKSDHEKPWIVFNKPKDLRPDSPLRLDCQSLSLSCRAFHVPPARSTSAALIRAPCCQRESAAPLKRQAGFSVCSPVISERILPASWRQFIRSQQSRGGRQQGWREERKAEIKAGPCWCEWSSIIVAYW